jgi:hypothetical protein
MRVWRLCRNVDLIDANPRTPSAGRDFTQRYVGEMFAKRSDKWGTDLDAAASEEFSILLAAIVRSIEVGG